MTAKARFNPDEFEEYLAEERESGPVIPLFYRFDVLRENVEYTQIEAFASQNVS